MKKVIGSTLKKGDIIALFAPSSPADDEYEVVEKLKVFIDQKGYKLEVLEGVLGTRDHYLAASDEIKVKSLEYAFKNDQIKAILCIRGGYSAFRLLDKIDYEIVRNNPKIFVGFSDVTTLLNAFYQKVGLISFHGPMSAFLLDNDEFTNREFFKTISTTRIDELVSATEVRTISEGVSEGDLVGGNLALISSMVGTEQEIDLTDKILFFEDVFEIPRRIERMLNQVIHSKTFSKVKGIIVGNFESCNTDNFYKDYSVEEVCNEFLKPLGIPVIINFSSGHMLPFQTLPIGARVKLDATNRKVYILEDHLRD